MTSPRVCVAPHSPSIVPAEPVYVAPGLSMSHSVYGALPVVYVDSYGWAAAARITVRTGTRPRYYSRYETQRLKSLALNWAATSMSKVISGHGENSHDVRFARGVCDAAPKALTTAHGADMPAIGYGTMELPQRPAERSAASSRLPPHRYGAQIRHRERVGEGFAPAASRSELFVTTKVTRRMPARRISCARPRRALRRSASTMSTCCWCIGRNRTCRSPRRWGRWPRQNGKA